MNIPKETNFSFPLLWEDRKLINGITARIGKFDMEVARPIRKTYIGIDPGEVNMGISLIHQDGVGGELWQIKFPSNCSSVQRVLNTHTIMREFLDNHILDSNTYAVIENASFGATYGQASLAENRTVAAYYIIMSGLGIAYIPPLSIRKTVFGSGKTRAEDVWPELAYKGHNDVASALACALYGYAKEL